VGRWIDATAINRLFLKRVNQVRAREGLTPLDDVMTQAWASPTLTLVGVSRYATARTPPVCPDSQPGTSAISCR
jgi:hypothetical protein